MGDTVCSGATTVFTSAITGGGTSPVYAWYINGTKVSIAATYTYIPADKDEVVCRVWSNEACAIPDTASSRKVMTVTDPKTPSVTLSSFPGDTICSGQKITFFPVPVYGGAAPLYTWRVNGTISGSGPSFTYVPAQGDIVRAEMTSNFPCLVVPTVLSNNVAVTVDSTILPYIQIKASPGTSIPLGSYDTLVAVVTGAVAPTYQWYVNGLLIKDATTNTFISNKFSFPGHDSVTCEVTSHGPCSSTTHNWVYISQHYLGVQPAAAIMAITVTPNPNRGAFTVKGSIPSSAADQITFEITNLLGQVVYSEEIVVNNGILNRQISLGNTLANGMYLLNVRSAADKQVFHIVLER